jgi:hypothetical protein
MRDIMTRRFILISIAIIFVFYSFCVFAEESIKPPRCIGGVCLGDHIEKYENKIEMVGKHIFGPLAVLKNEGRYISAKFDEMDESNWVQLSFCESPGIIKTIHRTIKADEDSEYYLLLTAYEEKYGKSETPDYGKSTHEFWHEWKWKNPETDLILIKKRGSNYISIELHSRDLAGKDSECTDREVLKTKTQEGLVPK